MPKTMVQLSYVQFFSWFALFSIWIYTTPAVTSYIYNTNEPSSTAYNDGADWVSLLFGIYNGIAALAALLLPVIAKYTSRRVTHFIALICGSKSLTSIPSTTRLSFSEKALSSASFARLPSASGVAARLAISDRAIGEQRCITATAGL